MHETLSYIIRFLLGVDSSEHVQKSIAYTSDESEFKHYKLVVYPSTFFNRDVYGTKKSLPELPLPALGEVPVLFGEPRIERKADTIILYADIIASTYFLISRYEEIVRHDVRDVHGRFQGRESLPFKAGFIDYPIVDKYGVLLRKLLREQGTDIPEPKQDIQKIYLTHDVDAIAHYRRLRGLLGAFKNDYSQIKTAFKSYFKGIEHDPWFTFDWLLKQNQSINKDNVESIFFIKPPGGKHLEDRPRTNINSKGYHVLYNLLKKNNARIGLHASYEAGLHPELIAEERKSLEKAANVTIKCNRHHFLGTREPEDMEALIQAGITDDFTMGYADVAGFRLGTCRPVQWINPVTKQLRPLVLHPLTIMDGSLSDVRYMKFDESSAYSYAKTLINETTAHGGDLCLLWHNTSVVEKDESSNSYHRRLYAQLIERIC